MSQAFNSPIPFIRRPTGSRHDSERGLQWTADQAGSEFLRSFDTLLKVFPPHGSDLGIATYKVDFPRQNTARSAFKPEGVKHLLHLRYVCGFLGREEQFDVVESPIADSGQERLLLLAYPSSPDHRVYPVFHLYALPQRRDDAVQF